MKYTIEATIPVVQYGNIKPMIEVESPEDEAQAVDTIKRLWERFGETQLKEKISQPTSKASVVKVTTFTEEDVLWNESDHIYTDMEGNRLLSGSKYADEHSPKFDLAMMLPKTANAWGVPEDVIKDMWKLTGDISTSWGSAVHSALELYHRYHVAGKMIQDKRVLDMNYVTPKNNFIRGLVLEFVDKFGVDALSEVVVSDVANKMAGTIDRLQIVDLDKKVCRVGDYKTNAEMDKKKLLKYQKQLSFYAHILINKGWKVEGLDLFYIGDDDHWVLNTMEVLPLE